MKDRLGREIHEGDFIIYVTRSEAPSLQFGWVVEIESKDRFSWRSTEVIGQDVRVKIHHAEPDGTRKNKIAENYYPDNPDGQRFIKIDTGRPSTVWLSGTEHEDHRMMVTQPI